MKMLDALRKRRSLAARRATRSNELTRGAAGPHSDYDQLNDKEVGDRLSQLSQVELDTVETYERAPETGRPCSKSCATCGAPNLCRATTL